MRDRASGVSQKCEKIQKYDAVRSRFRRTPASNDINRGAKIWEKSMKNKNLAIMSVDELWNLHEEVRTILSSKIDAERQELERRLVRLNGRAEHKPKPRRPYPKVQPKYCNPERPFETWSGRGKQPRWVSAQLRSGKKVDDLLISRAH
jgi:DNA-binding protein H-NS